MSVYWVGIKVEKMYLSSCSTQEKLQAILDKQADDPLFKIQDIQMVKDNGSDYAWIFYKGDFPKTKEANGQ